MKVLITGANGLLGSSIFFFLEKYNIKSSKFDRKKFGNKNLFKFLDYFSEFDTIIHTAANTNVEECEKYPEICYRDNTFLTEELMRVSSELKIKFVFISSTGIYGDSKRQAYNEYHEVFPTTHHHKSKVFAEKIVLTNLNSLVVRTGWLFGGDPNNKKNFVARRIEEGFKSNGTIYSNSEQFGSPTYVKDVAKQIIKLILDNQAGVFNCVNFGHASRFEYVREIIKIAKLDVQVKPSDASIFNRIANVPNNEMADNLKLRQLGYEELPNWQDSLADYITNDLRKWVMSLTKVEHDKKS